MTRRWRPRGSRSSAGSTRRTGRATPWSAQATRAPISDRDDRAALAHWLSMGLVPGDAVGRADPGDAAQARQGGSATGERAAGPDRPCPSAGPARLAAWRERRRSRRAAAVRRAHHAHGRDRARDHDDGDLGRNARATPAGGRAASICAARQSGVRAAVHQTLASRRGVGGGKRALAQYDRRTEAFEIAAGDDQWADQRAVVPQMGQGAALHRRAADGVRRVPRAQRSGRRSARRRSARRTSWSPATSSSTRRRCRPTGASSPSSRASRLDARCGSPPRPTRAKR